MKKGILKRNSEILKQEYIFTKEEEEALKNLILILGLNVTDLSEFLIKTSNIIPRDPTSIYKIKKNIKTSLDVVEKFNKFRLQNYQQKTISLLPKKTLLKGEENTPIEV